MPETKRPDKDSYFLEMAYLVATRSTCRRRHVGCVLVDRDGIVLATGYNGVPSGITHCLDSPCDAADARSGQRLDECWAIHAEQNAVLFASSPRDIDTCYTTVAPCTSCVKLLMNTGCRRVVFDDDYVHETAKRMWEEDGRVWNVGTHNQPL